MLVRIPTHILAAGLWALALLLNPQPVAAETLDRQALESIEEKTESVANQLLALSVDLRRADAQAVAKHAAPELLARHWPPTPATTPAPKGLARRQWPEGAPVRLEPTPWAATWLDFLARFSIVEDVRIKVKGADFDSDTVQARLKFYFILRNAEGRREWLKGLATLSARARDAAAPDAATHPWLIERFEPEAVTSLVAPEDYFVEVGAPAGVAVELPPYGNAGNRGFAWRGAAAGDINGDGLVDICSASSQQLYLYVNQGDGTFMDVALEAGLVTLESGTSPLFVDFDQDGDLDIFLAAVGEQVLFENRWAPDGTLSFAVASHRLGQSGAAVGFSATAADLNGDTHPDLYVCCYNRYGDIMPNAWDAADNGTPNLLFLSRRQADGGVIYEETAAEWGVDDQRWSYSAAFADIDQDGDLDLYVANDYGENGLYLNDVATSGRFRDVARERGVLDTGNGMGVAFGDIDNDGDLDLHVTNMSSTAGNRILNRLGGGAVQSHSTLKKMAAGNSLYENLGDGSFRPAMTGASQFSAGWAWGGGFLDIDNDGWDDLYSPNGFISGKSMKDT